MSSDARRAHMVYFEVEGRGYAVSSDELAGVATDCPATTYPGLPRGVHGIVQWSGKIFPIVQIFGAPREGEAPLSHCTYLFSVEGIEGAYPAVAVAVYGDVRVVFGDEQKAEAVSLSKLNRGGKKLAA